LYPLKLRKATSKFVPKDKTPFFTEAESAKISPFLNFWPFLTTGF
jgi:hypothetical protein